MCSYGCRALPRTHPRAPSCTAQRSQRWVTDAAKGCDSKRHPHQVRSRRYCVRGSSTTTRGHAVPGPPRRLDHVHRQAEPGAPAPDDHRLRVDVHRHDHRPPPARTQGRPPCAHATTPPGFSLCVRNTPANAPRPRPTVAHGDKVPPCATPRSSAPACTAPSPACRCWASRASAAQRPRPRGRTGRRRQTRDPAPTPAVTPAPAPPAPPPSPTPRAPAWTPTTPTASRRRAVRTATGAARPSSPSKLSRPQHPRGARLPDPPHGPHPKVQGRRAPVQGHLAEPDDAGPPPQDRHRRSARGHRRRDRLLLPLVRLLLRPPAARRRRGRARAPAPR
jgi:hypothetical protein